MHADLQRRDGEPLPRETLEQRRVRPRDGGGRALPLGGPRLVRRDGEEEARVPERPQAVEGAGEEADLTRVKGGRDHARLLVTYDIDERAVAIDDREARRARRHPAPYFTDSHFVFCCWRRG